MFQLSVKHLKPLFSNTFLLILSLLYLWSVDGDSSSNLAPIYHGNEALFRSVQSTRYNPGRSSLNVIDVVELFLLGSNVKEVENFLAHGSGQQRFAIDTSATNGGFFVSSAAHEALRSVPQSQAVIGHKSFVNDDGDLMILTRVRIDPPNPQWSTLFTISSYDHLSSANESTSFYRPVLSVSVAEDRLIIEYIGGYDFEPIRIPVPIRIVDEKWHSVVIHWTTNGGENDDFYVWIDCQLIYQGIAMQPAVFASKNWITTVGTPPLPVLWFIDEPPYFLQRRPFHGKVEQLVVTRDRFFWQKDDQCRYQRETSAAKNSCPICTSSTFLTNNAIKSTQNKLLTAIGNNKQKLAEEFDTIKEQLGAALRRIEFLEQLQKPEEEKAESSGKCFEKEGSRYFGVNDTWSVNNCSEQCTCSLVNNKLRAVCVPLKCSPAEVSDCPPVPDGGVVLWDLANGCCPRCQRKGMDEAVKFSGRSCVRWHRTSSVPHGAYFFIKLENDTCAEKRCIDGRETIVRQGPRSQFCGQICLRSNTTVVATTDNKGSYSRQVCCGQDSGPCKVRSCILNASSACDIPEKATCEDTAEDIICRCRPGWIGDGSRCIDVDECQEQTGSRFSANCSAHEVCINTPGSYYCVAKALPPDFESNFASSSLRKQNYPVITSRSANSAAVKCDDKTEILVRISPTSALCHCLPGFVRLRPAVLMVFVRDQLPKTLEFENTTETNSNLRRPCFDIDECQHVPNVCSKNHQCANIPGSYVCISSSSAYNHEAHEIKFTANARRSAMSSFAHRAISTLRVLFVAIVLPSIVSLVH